MDPLTILSVAAAVVSFVDFGSKILIKASRYLKSDDDLTEAIESLAQEAEQLSGLGRQIEDAHGRVDTSKGHDESDAALVKLARESILASEEVGALVSTLQSANDNRSGATLRSYLLKATKSLGESEYASAEKKMHKAEKRLGRIRNLIMSTVLASLWADTKSNTEAIRKISLHLDREANQNGQPATVSGPQSQVSIEEQQRQQLIERIWSQSSGPSDPLSSHQTEEAETKAQEKPSVESAVELHQAIIGSLKFTEMYDRKRGIISAHEQTFQWIFTDPETTENGQSESVSWPNFVSWLEQDDSSQFYSIMGKPGSGKSTLMKYILESGDLETHLARWARGGRLRIASFYSWNAGSEGQRSEMGLLRTILCQYLEQMPDLVAWVCPRRWAMHRIFGTGRDITLPSWTISELRQAFEVLPSLVRRTNYKLAMFIDGLDEFQVTDNFKFLLGFVDAFRSQAHAKVCVSNREWPVFIDYFHAHQSLRLQELTRNDIGHYIHSRLNESVAYSELRDLNPDEVEKLVGSILDKASGVFLWIRIVTNGILAGMESGQTITELYTSVSELPPDLSDLYQGIWNKLDTRDKINAARLFLIFDAHDGPLGSTTMLAADQPDSIELLRTSKASLEKLVSRRMRGQTKGLLEVSDGGNINYLHRTTKDWVSTIYDEISKILPLDFDANLQLTKGNVSIATCWGSDNKGRLPNYDHFWSMVGDCLEYASRVVARPERTQNVNELITVLDTLDAWATGHQDSMQRNWSRRVAREKTTPHWSSYQFLALCNVGKKLQTNTFLGLAAQYSILPYVQRKVGEHMKLKPPRWEISLLENALFIPGPAPTRPFWPQDSPSLLRSRFLQREELIRFLLEHGADPLSDSLVLCHISEISTQTGGPWRGFVPSNKTSPLYKMTMKLSIIGNKPFWKQVRDMLDENVKQRRPLSRLRSILSS